jgi:hypothetical protein
MRASSSVAPETVIGILSLLVYQNPVAEKTDPLGI